MKALVLGATSAIAEAISRRLAAQGAELLLVGRNAEHLQAVHDDLHVRTSARVEAMVADLDDLSGHEALLAEAETLLGGLDLVLVAHGVLGDPDRTRRDARAAARVLHTNLVSPVSLLTAASSRLEVRGSGVLVALSSVAGDRGRQSNYPYGAAKAGLSTFLQGLRNRLAGRGVHVVTVKLGFVDTPMTASLPKNLLYARPDTVARGILQAVARRRDVVYLPGFWRWIMLLVRAIPERVFKRMSL